MRWTIAQVAGAVGSRAGAGLDPVARVAGVSIDSRTVGAGELFIAIHGPSHDGHDYVASAFGRGAVGAMVAEGAARALSRRSTRAVHSRGRHVQGTGATRNGGARELGRKNRGRYRAASAKLQPRRFWPRYLGRGCGS